MIQPMRCPNCGAPLPDTDAEQVRCAYCGTVSQITRDSAGARRPFIPSAEGAAKLNAYAQQIERERENPSPGREWVPAQGASSRQRNLWLAYVGLRLLVILLLVGAILYVLLIAAK